MALVKIRRTGQITLPAEARRQLRLAEGDYLEAEVVEQGLLLKPVSAVERKRAWARILDAPKSVRYAGKGPRPSSAAEEEWIAGEVKAARREEDAKRRR